MVDRTLYRLLAMLSTKVDLDSPLFRGTVELAVVTTMAEENRVPPPPAVAELAAILIIEAIRGERDRAAGVFRRVDATPGCSCAGCRMSKWAKTHKAAAEKVEEDDPPSAKDMN